MTPAELKARIEAERAFEAEVEGMVFACAIPSPLAMRSAARTHRSGAGEDAVFATDAFLAALVPAHVRGWTGVTHGHLVAGLTEAEAAAAAPFDADLLLALFAARPAVFDAVAVAMVERYKARETALEDTLKN